MYKMAAYCRLSRDDGENKISESIENQLKMIREYVGKSDDLELVDVYKDDGFSGMYFDNRPEFQRMMRDIYKGKVQGVITKDISRLGREHIETSNYIERVFPSLQVRFIAILDGLDSSSHPNEELAQFKTLFNDMYCRDISKKIKGSLQIQKKRGDFMSGFAPYGYVKNPENKHQFLIDEEAAQVVKRIFYLYLAGYSKGEIARILNEERILIPSEYKRKVQGMNYANGREKPGAKGWSYPTLSVILKNRVYTGDMVQHKTEKISYKVNKYRYVSSKDQIVVQDTHEAIIDRDTFEQVQKLMKMRTRTPGFLSERATVNPYTGMLVCGDCGYKLLRVTCRDGYDCATYHKKGNELCKSHFVPKFILDEVVKQEIQRQAALAFRESDREEILKAQKKEGDSQFAEAERQLKRLRNKLSSIQRYRKKTYENYVDSVLNKEEYLSYKNEYEQQEKEVRKEIRRIEAERKGFGEIEEACEGWIAKFIKYGILEQVTREMVVELIDKIVVNGDKSIDIVLKYQSPYEQKEAALQQRSIFEAFP